MNTQDRQMIDLDFGSLFDSFTLSVKVFNIPKETQDEVNGVLKKYSTETESWGNCGIITIPSEKMLDFIREFKKLSEKTNVSYILNENQRQLLKEISEL